MRRKAVLLLGCLWLGAAPDPAFADPAVTGHRLFNWCRSEQASPLWMLCLGYVAGVADHMARNGGAEGYCPPEELSDENKRAIVMAYLDADEERRRESALELIVAGLQEAHPCG